MQGIWCPGALWHQLYSRANEHKDTHIWSNHSACGLVRRSRRARGRTQREKERPKTAPLYIWLGDGQWNTADIFVRGLGRAKPRERNGGKGNNSRRKKRRNFRRTFFPTSASLKKNPAPRSSGATASASTTMSLPTPARTIFFIASVATPLSRRTRIVAFRILFHHPQHKNQHPSERDTKPHDA